MNSETLNALTSLANKLGTTAEYLWGVLLKQAPITGVIELMVMVAWVVCAFLWTWFVLKKTTRPKATDKERYPSAEWEQEAAFFAWLSAFLLMFFVGVLISDGITRVTSALLNPEYWALRQIFK